MLFTETRCRCAHHGTLSENLCCTELSLCTDSTHTQLCWEMGGYQEKWSLFDSFTHAHSDLWSFFVSVIPSLPDPFLLKPLLLFNPTSSPSYFQAMVCVCVYACACTWRVSYWNMEHGHCWRKGHSPLTAVNSHTGRDAAHEYQQKILNVRIAVLCHNSSSVVFGSLSSTELQQPLLWEHRQDLALCQSVYQLQHCPLPREESKRR